MGNCEFGCKGRLVIFSAPSGAGKTTIVKSVIKSFPQLEFSISATSRKPRHNERNGVDYYFISDEEFKDKIRKCEFVEWEEVYSGTHYGTLRSEMERIWAKGNTIIFDVDVKGGLNLKKIFGQAALAVFIMPPSVDELRRRLVARDTDSQDVIDKRVAKARIEIAEADKFDHVVVNDSLPDAVKEVEQLLSAFMNAD